MLACACNPSTEEVEIVAWSLLIANPQYPCKKPSGAPHILTALRVQKQEDPPELAG